MARMKLVLVLLMSLWLPLQGVAAVIMPFCKHSLANPDQPSAAHHAAPEDHAGHSGHHLGHDGQEADDSSGSMLTACDDCGHCHLSCAVSLPSPSLPGTVDISFPAPHILSILPHGIVPLLLNRPPLPALI